MKVEVAVLSSSSLIVFMISVAVKQHLKKKKKTVFEQVRVTIVLGACATWTMCSVLKPRFSSVLLYAHRNRRLIRDGSPGRPPRLSHSS